MDFSKSRKSPLNPPKILDMANNLVFKVGLFQDEWKSRIKLPDTDQNWLKF